MMIDRKGDEIPPVSMMPEDGTYPSATTQWEKRDIALEIPIWNPPDLCIQCGKCSMVCPPHAAIRTNVYKEEHLADAPPKPSRANLPTSANGAMLRLDRSGFPTGLRWLWSLCRKLPPRTRPPEPRKQSYFDGR